MDTLWAPWRMKYILDPKHTGGCIFCDNPKADQDRELLILHRGKLCFIMLNLYPYNNGHMMVMPYRHISRLDEMTPEENADMMMLTQKCAAVLDEKFRPNGFNIGMNIGQAAGAGIDDHLHMHIVPRWSGDCNFMPVIGETKVMPQHLDATYAALIDGFKGQMKP